MSDRAQIDGVELLRVSGTTPQVGEGKLFTYTVYVEPRIIKDPVRFAKKIDSILADQRSWIRGNKVAFKRVASGANTQVILATPNGVDRLCAPLQTAGEVSCNMGSKVVINVVRWKKAVPHWTGSIQTYRQMVVNHEWGHRIGHGHASCPGPGKKAPVMQQQTYGLQGCKENSWPLASEL